MRFRNILPRAMPLLLLLLLCCTEVGGRHLRDAEDPNPNDAVATLSAMMKDMMQDPAAPASTASTRSASAGLLRHMGRWFARSTPNDCWGAMDAKFGSLPTPMQPDGRPVRTTLPDSNTILQDRPARSMVWGSRMGSSMMGVGANPNEGGPAGLESETGRTNRHYDTMWPHMHGPDRHMWRNRRWDAMPGADAEGWRMMWDHMWRGPRNQHMMWDGHNADTMPAWDHMHSFSDMWNHMTRWWGADNQQVTPASTAQATTATSTSTTTSTTTSSTTTTTTTAEAPPQYIQVSSTKSRHHRPSGPQPLVHMPSTQEPLVTKAPHARTITYRSDMMAVGRGPSSAGDTDCDDADTARGDRTGDGNGGSMMEGWEREEHGDMMREGGHDPDMMDGDGRGGQRSSGRRSDDMMGGGGGGRRWRRSEDVSDEELDAAVREVVQGSDVHRLTFGNLLHSLQSRLHADLTPRKDRIRAVAMECAAGKLEAGASAKMGSQGAAAAAGSQGAAAAAGSQGGAAVGSQGPAAAAGSQGTISAAAASSMTSTATAGTTASGTTAAGTTAAGTTAAGTTAAGTIAAGVVRSSHGEQASVMAATTTPHTRGTSTASNGASALAAAAAQQHVAENQGSSAAQVAHSHPPSRSRNDTWWPCLVVLLGVLMSAALLLTWRSRSASRRRQLQLQARMCGGEDVDSENVAPLLYKAPAAVELAPDCPLPTPPVAPILDNAPDATKY